MLKTFFLRIYKALLTVFIIIYLILDELIWERIAEPVYEFLHSLKVLQKLEVVIVGLNRYALLVFFLALFAAVELLGVVAIGLFAQGMILPATILYIGKIPITAFTFWMFKIAKEPLLTFAWFKFCYDWLLWGINKIKTSPVYLTIKAKAVSIKIRVKTLWASKTVQRIKAFFRFQSGQ